MREIKHMKQDIAMSQNNFMQIHQDNERQEIQQQIMMAQKIFKGVHTKRKSSIYKTLKCY